MRSRFLFFTLALGGLLSVNSPAVAATTLEECMSSAQRVWDNKKGWLVIDKTCPIGDGLWDRNPQRSDSYFWIQCGVTSAFPKAWFSNLLEGIVPVEEIVLRDEGGRYRCLLGPYDTHADVSQLRDKMRNNKHLKNAFIREISPSEVGNIARKASANTSQPGPETIKPVVVNPPKMAAQDQPTLVVGHLAKKEDKVDAMSEEVFQRKPITSQQTSRKFYQVDKLYSPEPYVDDLHHIEDQRAWMRTSLPEANSICQKNGMSLVSMATLQNIANNKSRRDTLPKRLPFWVDEQKAFDMAMMVPIRLTENSALYIMCEKK